MTFSKGDLWPKTPIEGFEYEFETRYAIHSWRPAQSDEERFECTRRGLQGTPGVRATVKKVVCGRTTYFEEPYFVASSLEGHLALRS